MHEVLLVIAVAVIAYVIFRLLKNIAKIAFLIAIVVVAAFLVLRYGFLGTIELPFHYLRQLLH